MKTTSPVCAACGATDQTWVMLTVPVFGLVTACERPAECRQRAIAKGIYKSTQPGGAFRAH